MDRWLVRLEGEIFDLEEYPRHFPGGDVYAIKQNGEFFLVGPALEALSDATGVLKKAEHMLIDFTAIIDLLSPGIKNPTIDVVIREYGNGKKEFYKYGAGSINPRGKMSTAGSVAPQPTSHQSPQAQDFLKRLNGKPHLQQAIALWSEPGRTWTRLYVILEEIERHIGKPVDKAGYCSGNERERFTRTANSSEAAGKDARHASGKFTHPSNPMTLEEGTRFIRRMLINAIQQST